MMPNGCLGSPVLVLLFGLDRGFLMDGGPTSAKAVPVDQLRCESGMVVERLCRAGDHWIFEVTDQNFLY